MAHNSHLLLLNVRNISKVGTMENGTEENLTNNVIAFPGARVDRNNTDLSISETLSNRDGLTELEWEELERQNLLFSDGPDKDRDLAYEMAFKKNSNFDITNLYHRPRFAQDFDLSHDLQVAFNKLELQFNQWDYLIRKIAYYKRS